MPCLLASPLMQQALAMADPSEPKYCHCQRISFGEMIACENPGAPGWLLQGCQQAGQQPAEGSTARLPASQLAMPLTARPAACLQTAHTSGSTLAAWASQRRTGQRVRMPSLCPPAAAVLLWCRLSCLLCRCASLITPLFFWVSLLQASGTAATARSSCRRSEEEPVACQHTPAAFPSAEPDSTALTDLTAVYDI